MLMVALLRSVHWSVLIVSDYQCYFLPRILFKLFSFLRSEFLTIIIGPIHAPMDTARRDNPPGLSYENKTLHRSITSLKMIDEMSDV